MRVTLGLVPLHRYPFDEKWAVELKNRFIESIEKNFSNYVDLVYPTETDTKMGLVTDDDDAEKVVKMFREKSVDGIVLITLTFGDELAGAYVAERFREKPIMIFATKEPPVLPGGFRRSDSFCGTLSLASALYRRKIPSLFGGIVFPEDKEFVEKMEKFLRTVNIIKNFVGARIGAIGPRPERFETVTYNEAKMAEKYKQRVVQVELLEVIEETGKLKDDDPEVVETLNDMAKKANLSELPEQFREKILLKLAKLEVILRRKIKEKGLNALAFRCWTEIQKYYGISPCYVLGRLTDSGVLSACEVDIYGALTMMMQYAATLGKNPPFFVDWTIRHPEKPNVFLAWHCGNMPPSLCAGNCKLKYHSIMYRDVGEENSYGTLEGKIKPGIVTISRLVEYDGEFKLFITRGRMLEEEGPFRGSWVWVEVDDLDKVYRTLIEEGFVHHASIIHGDYVEVLANAAKLLGIKTVIV